jgi:hypothetical protein
MIVYLVITLIFGNGRTITHEERMTDGVQCAAALSSFKINVEAYGYAKCEVRK